MDYEIMRKNERITIAHFSEDGKMKKYDREGINERFAPLQEKADANWLIKWWEERSIPMKQGQIERILRERGVVSTGAFLIKNLGLSLTDYYWIRPIGSSLRWQNVNLYENDFKDNILTVSAQQEHMDSFTPNSTLQGQLEKTWMIGENHERYLLKGNRDTSSIESINEVVASELHRLQGYDNYTPYRLMKIHGKEYDYACISKAFTSLDLELVSAYAVVTSEKKRNDVSYFEHFLQVCEKHGIERGQLQRDLDYMIMTDFILSGRDRHLNNVSILRDADTLRFIRMAPIYDSGKCLFVDANIPMDDRELLSIQTTSFAKNEIGMLAYVKDRSLVDVAKLPTPSYIKEQYMMDTQMSGRRADAIVKAYERKVQLFEMFQQGEDLAKIKATLTRQHPNIGALLS